EDLLQTLLTDYPDLLAGDQIDSVHPRRWLLVSREMSVPSEENGGNRWSVDHLFLDQEAIPTLIEVKRSSDTRIRREVVGQMLDYAANGVAYWPVETIRARFESNCQAQGLDPAQTLAEFLGTDAELDQFWQQVATNLSLGKLRMIFVADKISTELQRIVEFLNVQMSPAEVLAVEIKQYLGQGLKTLVPRVIGQTAEAQQKKAGTIREVRQWNESEFFEELKAQRGICEFECAKQIFIWSCQEIGQPRWGLGKQYGSLMQKLNHQGKTHSILTMWTNGMIEVFNSWQPEEKWKELQSKLQPLEFKLYSNDLRLPLSTLTTDGAPKHFLSALAWWVQEIKAS
ncbi:MAG TPA: hypothetical protein V6C63_13015, partial [Allocoleopsis sp.]